MQMNLFELNSNFLSQQRKQLTMALKDCQDLAVEQHRQLMILAEWNPLRVGLLHSEWEKHLLTQQAEQLLLQQEQQQQLQQLQQQLQQVIEATHQQHLQHVVEATQQQQQQPS